jgi:hypothetical protein
MTTTTFDTHTFIKRLTGIAELVTKSYLDARLKEAKGDIIKWVAGLCLGQAALVAALVGCSNV